MRTDRDAAASIVIKKIKGGLPALKKHLADCPHTPEARMAREAEVVLEAPAANPNASVRDERSAPLSKSEVDDILQLLVEFQAENCLADTFIEKGSTIRLIERLDYRLVEHLPSRRTLGGSLLTKYAEKLINEEAEEVKAVQRESGGRANFLSDGWQDRGRRHLLGTHLGLFGSFTACGLFPTKSDRLDGLALASRMEKIMKDAEEDGWEIGGVVTDDAGQCGRARRVLALRWPHVVFLKCFAHDLNNLVKHILCLESFRKVSKQAQAVVNFLNKSSEKWLPQVHKVMMEEYGSKWQFKTFCTTRWNSMQGCFASLLRVKRALRVFAARFRDDPEFNPVLKVLEDDTFWQSLKEAERVINPICFASFKLQSDENTLADVIIVFRDLFEKYQWSLNYFGLVDLVEERWAACEQPLFLLALYLHPAYCKDAQQLVDTKISGDKSICEIAEYYYKRLLGADPRTLACELDDWLGGTYMGKSPKELKDFETSSLPSLAAFWRHWKKMNPTHCLPKLALAVLSVTVNTATCERYFSELALIQTALRSSMEPEKTRKIAAIRKHVRSKKSKMAAVKPPAKRLISPIEPERSSAFSTPERRSSSSRSATPSSSVPTASNGNDVAVDDDDGSDGEDGDDIFVVDDVVGLWEFVFLRMTEEDVDDSNLAAGLAELESQTEESEEDGTEEEEDAPLPEPLPFPNEDDKKFPQENKLCGLRGRKVSLEDLRTRCSPGRNHLNFDNV